LSKIQIKKDGGKYVMQADEEKINPNISLQINIDYIDSLFLHQYKPFSFSNKFKDTSLKKFLTDLSVEEVEDSLAIAINKIPDKADEALKYFCGICWNKVKYPTALVVVEKGGGK
jgi:hypothetical protein